MDDQSVAILMAIFNVGAIFSEPVDVLTGFESLKTVCG